MEPHGQLLEPLLIALTMSPSPDQPRAQTRTSDLLIQLANASDSEEISVGELLEALSDRAFGIVMLVLALPCSVPFIYVIPQVVSVPMLLIALQISAGRHTLWMPEKLKARTFPRSAFKSLAARAQKYLGWAEAISAPRLTFLTKGGAERIFGLFMIVFAISIALPFPLTNTTPGIAVVIMSVGFIERDGLMVLVGTVLGTFWVLMLIFFASVFFAWLAQLQGMLFG